MQRCHFYLDVGCVLHICLHLSCRIQYSGMRTCFPSLNGIQNQGWWTHHPTIDLILRHLPITFWKFNNNENLDGAFVLAEVTYGLILRVGMLALRGCSIPFYCPTLSPAVQYRCPVVPPDAFPRLPLLLLAQIALLYSLYSLLSSFPCGCSNLCHTLCKWLPEFTTKFPLAVKVRLMFPLNLIRPVFIT